MSFVSSLRVVYHKMLETYYTLKWYKRERMAYNSTVVAVVDGRLMSGGMADRFKGIVSLYAWAKIHHKPFRIQYTHPFHLTDYVVPNQYDWIPQEGDYVESVFASKILCAFGDNNVKVRLDKRKGGKQIHYYGFMDVISSLGYEESDWGVLFKELFKPTLSLQNKIDQIKRNHQNYISVVFRFQNLLGDFPEYHYQECSDEKKRLLIKTCMEELQQIIYQYPHCECLVTSDSVTFLETVKSLKGVFIIPGHPIHMGSNPSGNYDDYEKSFLDFYMLADSEKIFSVVYKEMYPSQFPLYASKVNNIPFERIFVKS